MRAHFRWTKLLDKTSDSIKYSKETKELCRQGVPGKLRSRIWKAFINHRCSKLMKTKGPKYYQSLVQSPEISPSDKQISLDLHRSFPKNVHFSGDQGTKVRLPIFFKMKVFLERSYENLKFTVILPDY